jgi:hypothetical protein
VEVSRNRPRDCEWLFAALALVALPQVASAAERHGEPVGVTVRWSGADACDGGNRLRERIADDLGTAVPETTVDVVVTSENDGWRGAVTLRGASEMHREIVASECRALADAVALVTVVALDPFAIVERTHVVVDEPPEAPPEVPAVRTPAPAPTPVPAVVPPPRRPRPTPTAGVRVELGVSAFALPGLGPVLGLAPLVERGRLRIEAPVRWSLPRDHGVRDDVAGRLQLFTIGPRACFVSGHAAIGALVCGGLELGAMIASGRGRALVRTTTAAQPWVAAVAAVGLRWRVHRRFALWLAIESAVPFARPGFHVVADADVHRAAPATLSFAIGGELHFPSSRRTARRTQSGGATIARRVTAFREARDR